MKQVGKFFLQVFIFLVCALPAWAGGDSSDGHTHAAAEPVVAAAMSPRATATSDEFEVVAVLEGRKLVLMVDRFASNEPVEKASVEVEGAGLKGVASEIAPGTYAMDVATIPPGRHPLTITIEAGELTDLLSVTLDTSHVTVTEAHVHGRHEWLVWGAAALLLIVAGALIILRRRKKGIQA